MSAEVIGAAPGSTTDIDWHATWKSSNEYQAVQAELDRLKTHRPENTEPLANADDKASYRPFAAPWIVQMKEVMKRVLVQLIRTPSYLYAKVFLVVAAVSRRVSSTQSSADELYRRFLLASPSSRWTTVNKASRICCSLCL